MKKNLLFMFTLILSVFGVAKSFAASYSVDPSKEITAANLDGVTAILTDAAGENVWIAGLGGDGQDVTSTALSGWGQWSHNYVKFEKMEYGYFIHFVNEAGDVYSPRGTWHDGSGVLNITTNNAGIFIGGKAGRNGQDGADKAVWDLTYEEGNGYALFNVGAARYAAPVSGSVTEKVYVKLYSELNVPEAASVFSGKMSNDKTAWTGAGNTYGLGVENYVGGGQPEGEIISQTITGLPEGKYEVNFYAIANVARDLDISVWAGDGIAYAFANDVKQDITVGTLAALNESAWAAGVRSINCEVQEDGVLKYGIANYKAGGQWYVARALSLVRTGDLDKPANTIEAGVYTVTATVTKAVETIPAAFEKYVGEYTTTATLEGDETSLVITENAEEGIFTGFEIAGDAVKFSADKKVILGGRTFTVRAAGNEAETGSLAITPANTEGEYKMDAADIYYNGVKVATVSDIKIAPAPEEVVVKITYVDGSNPTTSYYDPNATQWQAGYNGISGGALTYPRTDWNSNWITYVGVDGSTMKGFVKKATLKMEVSGSTDSKRTTEWGIGYNTTPWSADMTDETADKAITLLGSTQWTSTKASGTFEQKTFDVTDAFAASKVATLLIYEKQAAGGYIKNITVEFEMAATQLEVVKEKALDKVAGLTVGEGLFMYSQADIDAYKAAVEAAETIEEVEAIQMPEMQKPDASKTYAFANVTATGTYLGEVQLSADPVAITFEETEGGYYLKIDEKYIIMEGSNTWTMTVSETPSTVWKINVVANGYTIQGPNGIVGTDNTGAGSATYGNKTAEKNGVWNIMDFATSADKVAADVATAKAKPVKYVKNGRLVIEKNGRKFNAAGAQL